MNKDKKQKAPGLAKWILKKILPFSDLQYLSGDFEEEYRELFDEKGPFYARCWYWLQTLKTTPDFIKNNFYGSIAMFTNYLKITLRNFVKNKTYSLINIGGLAVGLACCILILAYVMNEIGYDTFHQNKNNIYRLNTRGKFGPNDINLSTSVPPAGITMIADYPEVINTVRFLQNGSTLISYRENKGDVDNVLFSDNSIFEVFTFAIIKGDVKTPLAQAHTAVLTENIAKEYFGDEDPVGKVIKVGRGTDYTVTAIAANPPSNSHFTFDILFSMQTLYQTQKARMERWLGFNFHTYVLLQEGTDYRQLQEKMPDFVDRYIGEALRSLGAEVNFFLQPLTDLYLHTDTEFPLGTTGNIGYVYIFSAIAILILVTACINFMNLATARSATRAKEVGMRKVLGADRKKLISQFLGESVIYSFVALGLALIFVEFTLPTFSNLAGKELVINYTDSFVLIPGLLGLALVIGLISGSYPSLFLASFTPSSVMKGNMRQTSGSVIRSVLVVTQFTISISLIIGTTIIYNQLSYMKHKNLGFEKDQQLIVLFGSAKIEDSAIESLKNDFRSYTGIVNVSAASAVPGYSGNWDAIFPEGVDESQRQLAEMIFVDHDYVPTLGIELVEGRNFSLEFGSDPSGSILINETAAQKFGWDDPIGKTIGIFAEETDVTKLKNKKVVGVIKDMHFQSLHDEIRPLYVGFGRDENYEGYNMFVMRIKPDNIQETIKFVEEKWTEIAPQTPIDHFFLDERFDRQYRSDERTSKIFAYFAGFAIFIACLGLFAMASFTAERKTKEIGIRKVLGDTTSGIILRLNKELLKLVAVATMLSWPLAYYGLDQWLQTFPYKTDISILLFIASTAVVFAIALLTVIFQAAKAALANPVTSLRAE